MHLKNIYEISQEASVSMRVFCDLHICLNVISRTASIIKKYYTHSGSFDSNVIKKIGLHCCSLGLLVYQIVVFTKEILEQSG